MFAESIIANEKTKKKNAWPKGKTGESELTLGRFSRDSSLSLSNLVRSEKLSSQSQRKGTALAFRFELPLIQAWKQVKPPVKT